MKTWIWLALVILLPMFGCAPERKAPYGQDISDYWRHILYHQDSENRSEGDIRNRLTEGSPGKIADSDTKLSLLP